MNTKKLDTSSVVSIILILLSGAFSVGIYAGNTFLIGKRVDKLEKESTYNSKVLCLMALEVMENKTEVKKICLRGENL